MHKIEQKEYGIKLTFAGEVPAEEFEAWIEESVPLLKKQSPGFGVLVDMRTLKPLTKEARIAIEKGQRMYKQAGMERSAVILSSMVIAMQFKTLAKQSGIYEWERYIISEICSDWEQVAVDWIEKALDPDVNEPV